jgi:signal transduction histidine kinase
MNVNIKFRITVFIAAIALLVLLIAWTAHIAWKEIGETHQQVTRVQWKSLQSADHLQQAILGLNNMMLRYAAYGDHEDWANFQSASKELNRWINELQPIFSAETEMPLLDQLRTAYRDYLASASEIDVRMYSTHQAVTHLTELGDFEKQSNRMLDLGFKLATFHQESLDSFRAQNIRSLDILRVMLSVLLVLLFVAGCWLAIVVYRDMIAPLQVQLVESRQIVERQEKLVSLGMLAAGVAHEIRNPLTAIKAWLYLQQKHLKPGTPEFADAEIIGCEINRLERIVKDFLQFARPSEPQFTVVSAEQPLREVQTLLEPELEKSKIKLLLDEVAPVQIRIDPQQIKQVLINLVKNAADAIGKDGTVTLRVRLDEKRIKDRQTEVVILEVSDTGKGIPPEAEKRLFDPFFTTKDFGTGLGLPIAARIVEKHQGALQYQTRADVGTTFGIILPLHKS